MKFWMSTLCYHPLTLWSRTRTLRYKEGLVRCALYLGGGGQRWVAPCDRREAVVLQSAAVRAVTQRCQERGQQHHTRALNAFCEQTPKFTHRNGTVKLKRHTYSIQDKVPVHIASQNSLSFCLETLSKLWKFVLLPGAGFVTCRLERSRCSVVERRWKHWAEHSRAVCIHGVHSAQPVQQNMLWMVSSFLPAYVYLWLGKMYATYIPKIP